MPLLKRKTFSLLEPPNDLEPWELVFQVRFTKEIFRDYQEYLKRLNFYRQRIWTCKVTGKKNFTYEEALVSEQHAAEKVQKFPEEYIAPALRIIQYSENFYLQYCAGYFFYLKFLTLMGVTAVSAHFINFLALMNQFLEVCFIIYAELFYFFTGMLPLSDLVHKIKAELQQNLVEGLELQGKKNGYVCPCKIIKVLDEKAGKGSYEVAWLDSDAKFNEITVVGEADLVRKKFPFGREVLKSYVRESTYRSLPWVIHNELASKYGIPTEPPEDLKGKISFLNGCVIKNKKRKKNEELQDGTLGKQKREKFDGTSSDKNVENGGIKYPIDDQLVQPGVDDPVFTDRPSPSRDFTIQMDCVGDLLMVWDFCSSFGRLLYLWPFTLEDFEKAICHKDSNLTLIVETHATLLRLLINEEGQYYMVIQRKKRKPKITLSTWMEYLCDFLEMTDISELTSHIPTIKRGHYGLLEPHVKLRILKELVDQVIATDLVREKLDERLEERHALAASKRGEALEEGKKKREAKERLKAVSDTNGSVLEHNIDTVEDVAGNSRVGLEMEIPLRHCLLVREILYKMGLASGYESSGLREKTKKLLEDLERSKDERVRVVLPKSFWRKKWKNELSGPTPWVKIEIIIDTGFFRRDGRVFVENSDSKQWGYYCSKEELDALMGSLNPKGERERALKKQLDKHYPRISKELQKRSKDVAQRMALEEAVVRRSTRVRAPPKDNPSLAFLKYSNKWKVLMG
ncbi:Bromodomain adjacent to zinc finger domain protein 1A [Bienertia sinuspersici]